MKNLLIIMTSAFLVLSTSGCASSIDMGDRQISGASANIMDRSLLSDQLAHVDDTLSFIVPMALIESVDMSFDSKYEISSYYYDDETIECYIEKAEHKNMVSDFSKYTLLYLENLPHEYSYIHSLSYSKDYSQIDIYLDPVQFGDNNRIVLYASLSPVKLFRIFESMDPDEGDIYVKVFDYRSGEILDSIYY